MLLARSLAKTLALDYAAVEIWRAEEAGAPGPTNVVVAAWKSAASVPDAGRITVPVSIMAAGEPPASRDVSWRRLDGETRLRATMGQCAMLLTDDRAPVERLLAGRAACPSRPGP